MKKASELGKNADFKGCARWCDNFINRNLHLKKYLN